jgi:probable rRNA maturation factor
MLNSKTTSKITISNQTKGKLPSLPFLAIKDAVLGKKYELSIVFADSKLSKQLNKKWRGKNKPTNVLSFTLSENSGEIYLCPEVMRTEAPKFEKSYTKFAGFLLIHGMLHLKGMQHGSTMEDEEIKFVKKFNF